MKQRNCTVRVVKTKTLISFAVTVKLICVFVFAHANIRFSHNEAHLDDSTFTFMGVRNKVSFYLRNSLDLAVNC